MLCGLIMALLKKYFLTHITVTLYHPTTIWKWNHIFQSEKNMDAFCLFVRAYE